MGPRENATAQRVETVTSVWAILTTMSSTNTGSTHYQALKDQQYISLVTFKRNGDRVPTALWFAADGGRLLAYTNLDSGKVKRIRNGAAVEVAPCTMKGEPTGAYVAATATILDASQGSYVHGLLNRKYTWKKRLMEAGAAVPHILRIRRRKPDALLAIDL